MNEKEVSELREKVEQYMQFEAKYGKVKSENDILALKLAESQERQKLEA